MRVSTCEPAKATMPHAKVRPRWLFARVPSAARRSIRNTSSASGTTMLTTSENPMPTNEDTGTMPVRLVVRLPNESPLRGA